MKGVTETKGLQNLKTATTQRIRTKPPQRGTAHLDMYLLSKEKQRLEQELAHLDKRRARIQSHIAEVVDQLLRLRVVAQQEETGEMSEGPGVEGTIKPAMSSARQAQPRWKTMRLEY
ncbi:MAG: hypothetical protein ABID84_04350 [Chloroflexota bacterium]